MIPKKDNEGHTYGWYLDCEETGEYEAMVSAVTPQEIQILSEIIIPGTKLGIHKALEMLAQIKPIGSSEAKQATVLSYLAYDLIDEGISEFVVNEMCKNYRRSTDCRFFPDHSEFFQKAIREMKKYKAAYEAATNLENPDKNKLIKDWSLKLKIWKKDRIWPAQWGKEPGHPGCIVPKEILEEFEKINCDVHVA